MSVPLAPTFHPTVEEFKDPLKYIKSISIVGSQFGILKIVPPTDFQPSLDFFEEKSNLSFKTRNQTIGSLDGQTRLQLCYSQQLYKYHQSEAQQVYTVPEIEGKHVNMFFLSKIASKSENPLFDTALWVRAAKDLGFSSVFSRELKKLWNTWIRPMEEYLAMSPVEELQNQPAQMKQQMKPGFQKAEHDKDHASPKTLTVPLIKLNEGPGLSSPESATNSILSEVAASTENKSKDFLEYCKSVNPNISAMRSMKFLSFFEDLQAPFHGPWSKESLIINPRNPFKKDTELFDYDDSEVEWQRKSPLSVLSEFEETENDSEHEDTESDGESEDEFDVSSEEDSERVTRRKSSRKRGRKSKIAHTSSKRRRRSRKKDYAADSKKMHSSRPMSDSSSGLHAELDPKEFFPTGDEECCKCHHTASASRKIVICDDCERAYHLSCVTPTLLKEPIYSWICRSCIVATGKFFGFKDNEEQRNLIDFKKKADRFKQDYLAEKLLSDNDIENEFWKLTESPFEDITVEYGADLHTSIHGSGFPTSKDNPYSLHPWNLNNLPVQKESLFGMIKNDISGMMVPWLYVGMMFSAFCWHFEDHYTYSINYLHTGDSKTWYGVPASSAEKFEECMRKYNVDLFQLDPDLLFHLTTILSPHVLMQNDTRVFSIVQNPGDFVVTFPRAYHAGFNNGFNIAEAVNFAPGDWISFGEDSVGLYSLYKRAPVFSHEELILRTIKSGCVSPSLSLYLKEAFGIVLEREKSRRENCPIRIIKIVESVEIASEENQCSHCKRLCFLSCVRCQSCSQIVCLEHWDLLDSRHCSIECHEGCREINIMYSIPELKEIESIVEIASKTPQDWINKSGSLLEQSVSISEINDHLQSGVSTLGMDSFQTWNLVDLLEKVAVLQSKMKKILKSVTQKFCLQDLAEVMEQANVFMCTFPEKVLIEKMYLLGQETNRGFERRLQNSNSLTSLELEGILNEIAAFPLILPVADVTEFTLKQKRFLEQDMIVNLDKLDRDSAVVLLAESENLQLPLVTAQIKQFIAKGKEIESEYLGMLTKKETLDFGFAMNALKIAISSKVISKPVRDKCEQAMTAAISWKEDYRRLLSAEIRQKGNEASARLLYGKIKESPIMIKEMGHLSSLIRSYDGRKHKFLVVLGSKVDFALSARFFRQSFRLASSELPHDSPCICRTHSPGPCVQCTSCGFLYHVLCLRLKRCDVPFLCPCCQVTKGFNPYNKPSIEDIYALLMEMASMPIVSIECFELLDLLSELSSWLSSVASYLKDVEDIKVLRHWLRRLYGLPVITNCAFALEAQLDQPHPVHFA